MTLLSACAPAPEVATVVRVNVTTGTTSDGAGSGGSTADTGTGGETDTDVAPTVAVDPCVAAGSCVCLSHDDCKPLDPGDPCLGKLYCDRTTAGHACRHDPTRRAFCTDRYDSTCLLNACDPKDGQCKIRPIESLDVVCTQDKSYCVLEDLALWGNDIKKVQCQKNPCSIPVNCMLGYCTEYQNFCPCTKTADCKAEEDGDYCNGIFMCKDGFCVTDPATVKTCDTKNDTECLRNTCAPKEGYCSMKAVVGAGTRCDDGKPCTVGETCNGSKCVGGKPACPCAVDADCGVFDLGGSAFCDKGQCALVP